MNGYPLGRLFDVLNRCVDFLIKGLFVIADAVQIGASARYALRNPTGFRYLLVTHAAQRQLRCVEGKSILTVNSCSRTKGN